MRRKGKWREEMEREGSCNAHIFHNTSKEEREREGTKGSKQARRTGKGKEGKGGEEDLER